MKNISQLIYLTIFLILFVTCIFTIAELNLIAKSDYTNHLEQSVIMNASYFILCKLIVLSVITYVSGNALYHKIKDKHMEMDLNKSMNNISKGMSLNNIDFDNRYVTDPIDRMMASDINDEPDISTLQFDPIDQIDELDKQGIEISSNDQTHLYNRFGIYHTSSTPEFVRDRNGRIKNIKPIKVKDENVDRRV